MATKKQIAALRDIIASAGCSEQAVKAGYIGAIAVRDGGFVATDGCVIVSYREDIPELPRSNSVASGNKALDIVMEQIENGSYYLVQTPFNGVVCSSAFRGQLKEHRIPYYGRDNLKYLLIHFCSETPNGHEISGCYDARNVRRAVEAVGGKPRIYIGFPKVRKHPFPFLLVESDEPEKAENRAVVYPVLYIKKS